MDKTQAVKLVKTSFFVLLLLGFYSGMLNASELEIYPGAELVASSEDLNLASRRIILGPLKKINNILEPKSYIYVEGEMSSSTYYIPGERRVGRVAEFYEGRLNAGEEILFSCHGRGCGSSNYWADSIFNLPILYGPEQYQSYFIGLSSDKARYIAIYVAQRGTRKIYVHEQVVRISEADKSAPDLLRRLEATGRVVIPLTSIPLTNAPLINSPLINAEQNADDLINQLGSLLTNNKSLKVTLVAHDSVKDGESTEEAMKRTQVFADLMMAGLIESGIDKARLNAYGLGPLAPLESDGKPRLEVLIIR